MSEHPGHERLDEYVDGELDSQEARSVEQHLESCVTCRRQVESLRELLSRAGELSRSIQPERDLWAGIRERIERPDRDVIPIRRGFQRWWVPAGTWQAAAAAVLLVAATATVTWRVAGSGSNASSRVAVESEPAGEAPGNRQGLHASRPAATAGELGALVSRELAPVEDDYLRTTAHLLEILNQNRDQLAPETRKALDRTLTTLDRAIRDLRAALEEDPNSRSLGLLLESTYRQKIDVLRETVRAAGT